jgi:quinol monooxygenase YgiN
MIHVVAVITTQPGQRATVLDAFRANAELVRAEDGCIAYTAVVDAEGFGSFQAPIGPDTFFVIEQWASPAALKAHAAAPHMKAYGEKVSPLTASRAIHILSPA